MGSIAHQHHMAAAGRGRGVSRFKHYKCRKSNTDAELPPRCPCSAHLPQHRSCSHERKGQQSIRLLPGNA